MKNVFECPREFIAYFNALETTCVIQVIKEYRLAMRKIYPICWDYVSRDLTWDMFLKMLQKRGSINDIIKFLCLIKQSKEDGNLMFPSDFFEMVEMEERKQ